MVTMRKIENTTEVPKFSISDSFQIKNSEGEIVQSVILNHTNFYNLSDKKQRDYTDSLAYFFQGNYNDNIQIYAVDEGVNTHETLQEYDSMIQSLNPANEVEELRLQMLDEEKINLEQRILNREVKDKFFHCIFTSKNESSMIEDYQKIIKGLNENNISYEEVGNFERVILLYKYLNPMRSQFEVLPKQSFSHNTPFRDFVRLNDFHLESSDVRSDYIISDGCYQKCMYVMGMPVLPYVGFLSKFAMSSEVDFSIHISKGDTNKVKKSFNKAISSLKRERNNPNLKESDIQEFNNRIYEMEEQIVKITNGYFFYNTFLSIRLKASTLEDLEKLIDKVTAESGRAGFTLKQGFGEQKEFFNATAPLGYNPFKKSAYSKPLSSDTLGFGYPMIHEALVDKRLPIYVGSSFSGGGVFIDTVLKTDERPNSNEFISGVAGSGKTTLIMKLINDRFARGEKQFVIDVVGAELPKLVNDLYGENINCSGNGAGMFNPLQIRIDIPQTDDEEIDLDKIKPLALHIFFLRNFFKIYIGADVAERDLLARYMTELCEDCYATQFGINLETTGTSILERTNTDFPIFKDLYEFSEKRYSESVKGEYGRIPKEKFEMIRIYLRQLGTGADSTLFNGYTNVDLENNNTILFDISGLQMRDNQLLVTQYYNIISYVWGYVTTSRKNQFKRIVADEGHNMFDVTMPELSSWMRKITKEDRKFECGLLFGTQELADVLGKDVSKDGTSVLANSCYQYFFMCDAQSRVLLSKQNRYDEKDLDFIEKEARRGQCLLRYGHHSMRVEVKIGYLLDKFESYRPKKVVRS